MAAKISGFILLSSFLLLFGLDAVAQRKVPKSLLDSTRIKEKYYKMAAKHAVDSAKAKRKFLQDSIRKKTNPDTLAFFKSLRLGVDFARPITSLLNPERQQFEVLADYHWKNRTFLSAELGYEHVGISHPGVYSYHSSGEYLRAGFDYSILRLERPYDENIVFIGLRVAAANVSYQAQDINIQEGYFGNTKAVLPAASARAYWAEFLFGIKVKLVSHISLGWTMHLASQFNDLTTRPTYPIFIPGFGNSSSTQNITYNYSIFYTF